MSSGLRFTIIILVTFGLAFIGLQLLAPRSTASLPPNNPSVQDSKGGNSLKTAADGSVIIDWRILNELDLQTKRRTPNLVTIDGKKVRIAGFMVPLEDYQYEVKEFLLVPSPQMCIHVPAPPANQMVYVKMADDVKTKTAYGPIWVEGQINIVDTESPYGDAGFELKATAIKPFSRLQD